GAEILKTERTESTDARIQQAKLYLAYTAPGTADPDYLYGKIIVDILGGGMSSPYFTALRKERGFAYSVGMTYPSRLCASRMTGYIGLQEEHIAEAITVMQELNSTIAANISEEELEKAKNHMLGQILLEAETNSRTAFYAAFYENLGLGFDFMSTYVEQIRNVKKDELKTISKIFAKPHTIFVYKPVQK
ncbi:MAG: insulinase family protein, partial [Deferribacteraceae bacterium]|nr:insulinase family protein [Deferribacteraceae bacterium]